VRAGHVNQARIMRCEYCSGKGPRYTRECLRGLPQSKVLMLVLSVDIVQRAENN
jgi:hypothetical protein